MKTRKEHNQQLIGLLMFLLIFIGLGIYCLLIPESELIFKGENINIQFKVIGVLFCLTCAGLMINSFFKIR